MFKRTLVLIWLPFLPLTVRADGVTDFIIDPISGFLINQRGSYRLSASVSVAEDIVAITVIADDVAIDLNGHTITGYPNGSETGIIGSDSDRLTVRNGRIVGFGAGLVCTAPGAVVSDLTVENCGGSGVVAGTGARINNVSARGNGKNGGHGISVTNNAVVEHCVASQNIAAAGNFDAAGIRAGTGCVIRNCAANANAGHGTGTGYGIWCGSKCTITGNACSDNTGEVGQINAAIGLFAADNCTISGNTCSYNRASSGRGMVTSTQCLIENNVCSYNGTDWSEGHGVGIEPGSFSTVRGNTVSDNHGAGPTSLAVGISAFSECLIEGNLCSANSGPGGTLSSGIRAVSNCTVRKNTCNSNGGSSQSSGIFSGTGCVIIGNTTRDNQNGIVLSGAGNRVQENITHESAGVQDSGGNSIGTGDLANITY